MTYFEESGMITKQMWDAISTMTLRKRPGTRLIMKVPKNAEILKHWRTTKNGKARLYLVKP